MATVWGSLTYAQKETEPLRPRNSLLTKQLADCTSATLDVVSQSFENALQ